MCQMPFPGAGGAVGGGSVVTPMLDPPGIPRELGFGAARGEFGQRSPGRETAQSRAEDGERDPAIQFTHANTFLAR